MSSRNFTQVCLIPLISCEVVELMFDVLACGWKCVLASSRESVGHLPDPLSSCSHLGSHLCIRMLLKRNFKVYLQIGHLGLYCKTFPGVACLGLVLSFDSNRKIRSGRLLKVERLLVKLFLV